MRALGSTYLLFGLALVFAGCQVSLDDPAGRACDDAHPCAAGRTCHQGFCVVEVPVEEPPACGGATVGEACSVGEGACRRSGQTACINGEVRCDVEQGTPAQETCDGLDNDCDGAVDEAEDLQPPACPLTKGVCGAAQPTCEGADGWSACTYDAAYEAVEALCDGQDNDCDGIVDEISGCLLTLAGLGPPGYADGAGAAARFSHPSNMTADAMGNLYVADRGNHVIRKVAPDGTVTTVAGDGHCGFSDGAVADARFCEPFDVELGAGGELYVSDHLNNRIRRIANGQVVTIAGSGSGGFGDGQALAAKFSRPAGLSVLPDGDLLIADHWNHRIRRYDAQAQTVSTVAGAGHGYTDGTALTMTLADPVDAVMDSSGALYIAEAWTSRLRVVPPGGTSSNLVGTLWRWSYKEGSGGAAELSEVSQLHLDEAAGVLYFADAWNMLVRAVPLNGAATYPVAGSYSYGWRNGTTATAQFNFITGFARVGADWFVADWNHTIRRHAQGAVFADGVVSDFVGGSPDAINADGPADKARLWSPFGLDVAPDGTVYWVEPMQHVLRARTPDAEVTTLVGDGVQRLIGHTNGTLPQARLSYPTDLTFGPDGLLYLTDAGNNVIRRVDLTGGTIETWAGPLSGERGLSNGDLSLARFSDPVFLGFGKDPDGKDALYVFDRGNALLRRIDLAAGTVSTFAGTAGVRGTASGAPGVGTLRNVRGVSGDDQGNVYLVDSGRLRRADATGTLSTLALTPNLYVQGVQWHGGQLFVTTQFGVYRVDVATGAATQVFVARSLGWLDGMSGAASTEHFTSIAVTETALYLSDEYGGRIRRVWR